MGDRWVSDLEALEVWDRLEYAIAHELPVTLTYFKARKDRKGDPVLFKDGTTCWAKIRRTVEPYRLEFTQAGHPVVYVVDRSPNDEKGPMYRTVRLDRIAAGTGTTHRQRRPRVQVHAHGKRYCQGLITLAEEKHAARIAAASAH